MARARRGWTWLGAAGLLVAVTLLASSCNDAVPAASATGVVPAMLLHHPKSLGPCPCIAGEGSCPVCHALDECACCDLAEFCPADPCQFECVTFDEAPRSFVCPSRYPVDCNDGTCCPDSHPNCCGGTCVPLDGTCD